MTNDATGEQKKDEYSKFIMDLSEVMKSKMAEFYGKEHSAKFVVIVHNEFEGDEKKPDDFLSCTNTGNAHQAGNIACMFIEFLAEAISSDSFDEKTITTH